MLLQLLPLPLTASIQSAISHCHASQQPLLQLRLAPALQTILHHASVHGLRMWLSSIPLPLMPPPACVEEPAAPPLPAWYPAAVAAMDNDTAKQVLMAAAATAAAAAAGLVSRSDAALTPPCAASAMRWCAFANAALAIFSAEPHRRSLPNSPAEAGTLQCALCGRLRGRMPGRVLLWLTCLFI